MDRLRVRATGRFAMNDIRRRLDHELQTAVMELPTAIRDNGGPFASEVDGSQMSESREIGFATRELLVERVKRLVAALDRLNDGEYGICVECAVAISPGRLRAAPEAQTCICCQDWLERQR
jgi:RNA polymerase-binding transcription factor DksA